MSMTLDLHLAGSMGGVTGAEPGKKSSVPGRLECTMSFREPVRPVWHHNVEP
jgi:hypothetical protein